MLLCALVCNDNIVFASGAAPKCPVLSASRLILRPKKECGGRRNRLQERRRVLGSGNPIEMLSLRECEEDVVATP